MDIVREHVALCSSRRDQAFINQVFDRYATTTGVDLKRLIPKENLANALSEIDGWLRPTNEIETIFYEMDLNSDGGLDLEEFVRASQSLTELEQWLKQIPFYRLMNDAITALPRITDRSSRTAAFLTTNEIENICSGAVDGLCKMLRTHCERLRSALESMDKRMETSFQEKFQIFDWKCGNIDDFHEGLEKRIGGNFICFSWSYLNKHDIFSGHPHIKFLEAMEAEHCKQEGCNWYFTTRNYNIKTTPSSEWKIVLKCNGFEVNGLSLKENGEGYGDIKDRFPNVDYRSNRRIPNLKALKESKSSKEAKLNDFEILSLILYTGPMVCPIIFCRFACERFFVANFFALQFYIYNIMLRQYPEEIFKKYSTARNLFSTTIHVLISAVQKLARAIKVPDGQALYRGLGGTMRLPQQFTCADAQGRRGFTEWAFVSTTTEREIAFQYSGVHDNMPMPTVLQIQTGAVDRGACIQEFSQYPKEVEHLWVPGSFFQPAGSSYMEVTEGGAVLIVPVRINTNQKALTVEEHVGRKKKMHLTSFKYIIGEIEQDILEKSLEYAILHEAEGEMYFMEKENVSAVLSGIMQSCEELYQSHFRRKETDFEDHKTYRLMLSEMLGIQRNADAKIEELRYLRMSSNPHFFGFAFPVTNIVQPALALSKRFESAVTRTSQYISKINLEFENPAKPPNVMSSTLGCATSYGSEQGIKLAVQIGADITEEDDRGRTILLSSLGGSMDGLIALVELGSEVNHRDKEGKTALMIAAEQGNAVGVHCLLDLQADIDLADDDKNTALTLAFSKEKLGCFKVLVEYGANTDAISGTLGVYHLVASRQPFYEFLQLFKVI